MHPFCTLMHPFCTPFVVASKGYSFGCVWVGSFAARQGARVHDISIIIYINVCHYLFSVRP